MFTERSADFAGPICRAAVLLLGLLGRFIAFDYDCSEPGIVYKRAGVKLVGRSVLLECFLLESF